MKNLLLGNIFLHFRDNDEVLISKSSLPIHTKIMEETHEETALDELEWWPKHRQIVFKQENGQIPANRKGFV